MTSKLLYMLLLAVVAAGTVVGQSEDIPVENDNQFPPDKLSDDDIVEGSGQGTIEEPLTVTVEATPGEQLEETTNVSQVDESTLAPILEQVQGVAPTSEVIGAPSSDGEPSCPNPCVCNKEGGTTNFVVDCSGYGLTEFPSPLDPRITTLNVRNNKLTEIPKDVSALKNLKVLNANNNSIMDVAAGSISELDELTELKLANNRLIEYPQDLKNSFSLTKLQELDLGGNDMRTALKPEIFSNFKALRTLTLPLSTPELTNLVEDLCGSLKDTLETVCTETCKTTTFECPDAPPQKVDEDLFDAVLPGVIAFAENVDFMDGKSKDGNDIPDNIQPGTVNTPVREKSGSENAQKNDDSAAPATTASSDNGSPSEIIRSRSGTNKEKEDIVESPKEETNKHDADVKIGATTDAKTGGVDKSVIGIIVAGMVVVVAGIVIKKNWTSIKKRFSSSSRTPTERAGAGANGTAAPEEVPLQDKSPV